MTVTAASGKPEIDITAFIDRQRVSRFQALIVALCFLIVAIDGFDTAAIGFIGPVLRAQWNLSPTQLAQVFVAGLAGLMAGAFLFGPLGDRVGRKRMLIASVFAFGAASCLSALAPTVGWLAVLRFLTGLGLGSAMPNAITLTSEYCPTRTRSLLVTTMFCGFTLGSALGGFAAAALLAFYSWPSVLLVGGVMPIALGFVLMALLPESVRYMVRARWDDTRIADTLGRIAPQANLAGRHFVLADLGTGKHAGPLRLLAPDLRHGTVLLWITFFMSLLVIYLLQSWMPTLFKNSGMSMSSAAIVAGVFQIGGTLGAIAMGWLMDRFSPSAVLASAYLLAAIFIAAVGHLTADPWLTGIAVFWAGVCVSGTQVGANALSAAFYPTECRATGVSLSNGIGRCGSMLGALAGGSMLSMGLAIPTLFMLVGVPCVVAALTMLLFGLSQRAAASAPVAVAG
ncbi:MAG: aromatic acid/H+ symport family MFS transporter [Burkholderiaceae bacterium]|jgi:AAHS family 4-hydroxybenzoate transporter-like MFS transporter|nr:aromatic acid/H+ symport family MFS transporter [Burkholderiaceae bacterium]